MKKGKRVALCLGSIPFLTLVFALPLVNRLEFRRVLFRSPILNSCFRSILGLPFILFWIVLWVFLTPFILMAAYRLGKKSDQDEGA